MLHHDLHNQNFIKSNKFCIICVKIFLYQLQEKLQEEVLSKV